jgi:hypothetical protein
VTVRSKILNALLIPTIIGVFSFALKAQVVYETMPTGSFIINMGIVPQTVGNALKPYGMVYDLVKNYGVPIKWIIDETKGKDGIDFIYNGVEYRGGPFIIQAQYRTSAVNARIAYWTTQPTPGVIGITTISPISVPVAKTLTVSAMPNWTLDYQNGAIALPYFANAGIPPSAYGGNLQSGWKTPAQLNDCDDVFVMPHADPKWATHSNLLDWNLNSKGSIWTGCHAGSALENMYNPANPSQQTNFLTKKVTTPGTGIILPVFGSTAYSQNSLILWENHDDGTPPYSYHDNQDPVMQFMGIIDAAVLNGSEQIYIPVKGVGSGWRESTVHGVYDPDHPEAASVPASENDVAAVVAYGRGFGDPNRGWVMMEASHKFQGTTAPFIAAQRIFFNFSFLAGKTKSPDPEISTTFPNVPSGGSEQLSISVSPPRTIDEFTVQWTSSCGGSFTQLIPEDKSKIIFNAPVVSSPTNCNITVTLTDGCNRSYKATGILLITCNLQVATTINSPCFGQSNGSIVMNITGGTPNYNWSWTRTGGGTGSGSGTSSPTTISGLAAGTYTVTVASNSGAGCSKTFTVTLTANPAIIANATPVNVLCNGASTGSVNLTVSGGTPGYTYTWTRTGGGYSATTQNINGLPAGIYNVTVTDSKGCTQTASATVTQPDAITVTPSITNLTCNGQSTGSITLVPDLVTGGLPPYTYLWSNGSASPTISNLAAGSYSVTVTDANGCTKLQSGISVTQPSAITASAGFSAISCNGGTSIITVTASGGTGTLQYSLNGASYQPGNQFTGISASATPYIISVKDANNCTTTTSVTVTQPAPLALSATVAPETCTGFNDGAITLNVSGGTGTYTFNWSDLDPPPAEPQNRTGLAGGTYSVTVTDANNCSVTLSNIVVPVTNPNPVQPGGINH